MKPKNLQSIVCNCRLKVLFNAEREKNVTLGYKHIGHQKCQALDSGLRQGSLSSRFRPIETFLLFLAACAILWLHLRR